MKLFSADERAALKAKLLEAAARDARLSGVAVTGSAAAGREDRWSDIDLALGVSDTSLVAAVMGEFSDLLYAAGALHHHDLAAGAWTWRVFFLPGGLQVDLAFVDGSEFRPLGPDFQLVSGEAQPRADFPEMPARDLVSWAWLHALHARSSLLRGKLWQAEYMMSAVRDYGLALACRRLALPSAHGRGMDALPEEITGPLRSSLVGRLEAAELWRALAVVLERLAEEMVLMDPAWAGALVTEVRGLGVKPPGL